MKRKTNAISQTSKGSIHIITAIENTNPSALIGFKVLKNPVQLKHTAGSVQKRDIL
jgi:hypothetical protein